VHEPEVTSSTRPSPALMIPPPLLFLGAFALGLFGARWLGFARTSSTPGWPLRTLGVVMIALGVGLALSSLALFARARTTIIPHGRAAALVTNGPYRWTRNPMYVALTTQYLGVAAVIGALGPIVTLPLALLVIGIAVIPHEERGLTGVFGAEYTSYCARVRRWL
jgi:protein-S-isoprenylcysteine O-methyltransferase Ste14